MLKKNRDMIFIKFLVFRVYGIQEDFLEENSLAFARWTMNEILKVQWLWDWSSEDRGLEQTTSFLSRGVTQCSSEAAESHCGGGLRDNYAPGIRIHAIP